MTRSEQPPAPRCPRTLDLFSSRPTATPRPAPDPPPPAQERFFEPWPGLRLPMISAARLVELRADGEAAAAVRVTDTMTVGELRRLQERARWAPARRDGGAAGVECCGCRQRLAVYSRPLSAAMAHALILAERRTVATGEEWFRLPDVVHGARDRTTQGGGEPARLRFHGLLEERREDRGDGSDRAGLYRVTALGGAFVHARAEAPRYVYLCAQEPLGVSEETIGIRAALGDRFNYDRLMAG